jgi:hypothetical protein
MLSVRLALRRVGVCAKPTAYHASYLPCNIAVFRSHSLLGMEWAYRNCNAKICIETFDVSVKRDEGHLKAVCRCSNEVICDGAACRTAKLRGATPMLSPISAKNM